MKVSDVITAGIFLSEIVDLLICRVILFCVQTFNLRVLLSSLPYFRRIKLLISAKSRLCPRAYHVRGVPCKPVIFRKCWILFKFISNFEQWRKNVADNTSEYYLHVANLVVMGDRGPPLGGSFQKR